MSVPAALCVSVQVERFVCIVCAQHCHPEAGCLCYRRLQLLVIQASGHARPGDEGKVEKAVKEFRSLSLLSMRGPSGPPPYMVSPACETTEPEWRDSTEVMAQARRRKNITEFLGDSSIPLPDSLPQHSASLPSSVGLEALGGPGGSGSEKRKNKAASRFSGFFGAAAGAGPFNKELDRMELLQSKLHTYTTLGLPKMPKQLLFHQDSWEEEEEEDPGLPLEESWQQLIDAPQALSMKQCHQQEAIWELLQTEALYIRKLRVITDVSVSFLCTLLSLQESGLLLEVQPKRLFSNIGEILQLHRALWREVMAPLLETARRERSLLNPDQLHSGFSTFGSRFKPYTRYCMQQEDCMDYMRGLLRDNELFRTYITWAETHKQCNRLKLTDMLVKPHQRLTKYPLLLKSVLKKTEAPESRDAVSSMVGSVERFINQVNSRMRQRQEQQRLAAVTGRIHLSEVVEGGSDEVDKILRGFYRFDLTMPMRGTSPDESRQLHLEGALRMKEGKDSKMDVYCFLFTDLLLITKPLKRAERAKVIRQPLLLENIVCQELKDPGSFLLIYLNEFQSAVAAYSFQASSQALSQGWVEAICNAQTLLGRLRAEEVQRGEEEGKGRDPESRTSTASSPSTTCRNQRDSQHSSTETIQVEVQDAGSEALSSSPESERGGPFSSPSEGETASLSTNSISSETPTLAQSPPRFHVPPAEEESSLATQGSRPASRSLPVPTASCIRSASIDSAYGTLSNASLMRRREEEGETEEEEEEAEKSRASNRPQKIRPSSSSLSSSSSSSTRLCRQPPVQPRTLYQRTSPLQSKSEANLLELASRNRLQQSGGAGGMEGGSALSKSLTQLCDTQAGTEPRTQPAFYQEEEEEGGQCKHCGRTSRVADSLKRGQRSGKALGSSCSSSGSELKEGEAGETAHHTAREEHCSCLCTRGDVTAPSPTLSPHSQSLSEHAGGGVAVETGVAKQTQHKKLTLAQLYRIRTSLVLNSTLTASEV
ncbi:pleckstrin homology domain-containing family G member 5-like [Polyodon spathula]|uniref:pleckstrin homology domain-containing family G member 5-like n=1 Tax=Polyodon spathula TaxID=7913 RepID=UPI001B7ED580|nr:pleckstrin homology domain-containing family G member 5-like [Polyodon spathula]